MTDDQVRHDVTDPGAVGRDVGDVPSHEAAAPVTQPGAGAWARAITLGVVAVLLGLSTATVVLRAVVASDHTWVPPSFVEWHDDGVTIRDLGSGSGGPRQNDIVVAVDGRRLSDGPPAWGTNYRPGDRLVYEVLRDGQRRAATVELDRYPLGAALEQRWGILGVTIPLLTVAVYIFRRNPAARAAHALLIFAGGMAASSAPFVLGIGAVDVAAGPVAWLRFATSNVGFLVGWCGLVALALWFPEPQPAFATRPAGAAVAAFGIPLGVFTAAIVVAPVLRDSFIDQLAFVFTVQQTLIVLCIVAAFALVVLTWRRTRDPVARQQLRWFAGSGGVSALLVLAGWFLPELLLSERPLPDNLLAIAGLPVLVGGTVAVLRYKMFELDIVLNRALVYGALTALLAGLFGLVAGGIGTLVEPLTALQAAVVAAVVVVLVVNPLRRILQRGVNRLFYGDRDEPYAALARLGRRLEASRAAPTALPDVAAEVAASLRIPFAAIDVLRGPSLERVAAFGEPRGTAVAIPLMHRSETVGQLVVSPRTSAETLSDADWRVLVALAPSVGAAAANLRLAEHLQRSREELVLAREEERRRLRRELHDGLGPTLSALALQIEAARRRMASDPAEADNALERVRRQAQQIVEDIRRMAYELRPPTLDELGLIEALRERAAVAGETGDTRFTVEVDGAVPGLPAAVEARRFA